MSKTGVRFEALDKLLVSLGFQREVVPGTRITFRHTASGAILRYPPYEPETDIAPRHLVAARATLDRFGVMERSDFDEQLRQHSLAG